VLVPLTAISVSRREDGRAPAWVTAGALSLAVAGLCDWAENFLLLASLEKESPNRVDAAHAIAIPKLIFFAIGAAAMIYLLVQIFRRRRTNVPQPPP
jgi:hypothetical protein